MSKQGVGRYGKKRGRERTGRSFFVAWYNEEEVSWDLHEGGVFMKEASEVRGDT
jgi:hypothetical protein